MSASDQKPASTVAPVTKIGNLTGDPELRFTPTGKPVCNFSIAVTPYNAETKERGATEYYRVVLWDSLAENAAESLQKGTRVIVQGRPELRHWTGDDGKQHTDKVISGYGIGPDLRWVRAAIEKSSPHSASESDTSETLVDF